MNWGLWITEDSFTGERVRDIHDERYQRGTLNVISENQEKIENVFWFTLV